jgi:hypothetical protein
MHVIHHVITQVITQNSPFMTDRARCAGTNMRGNFFRAKDEGKVVLNNIFLMRGRILGISNYGLKCFERVYLCMHYYVSQEKLNIKMI